MSDDADSLGDDGKAAFKGQIAGKIKSSPVASAILEAERGNQAFAAGRCEQALGHYHQAIRLDPKQLSKLAGKVRTCAMQIARTNDLPLLKALKSYPALAGLLLPELEKVRRARASAESQQQVRGPRKATKAREVRSAPPVKAVPSKADAVK